MEATKPAVLDMAASLPDDMDDEARDTLLSGVVGQNIKLYNLSRFTFASLKGQNAKDIHKNLVDYITKFSSNVRDVFLDKFLFTDQLKRLNDAGLLFRVFDQFTQIDLHPEAISNLEMGYLFEELIRRFSEISNETAGEHYTPREVIRLIVSLLLANDTDALTGSGVIRQIYDPAAGTGGMLSIAEMQMKALNARTTIPNSPRCARMALTICVCWRTRNARALWVISNACVSSLFTGTNRIDGRDTASQIASASAASVLPRLT